MNLGFINFSKPITGNFLVDIIFWLVQVCSSVTLGVILFTVILKLITLPFDFFSRASMRKNSLKMEQMRPELEKLQKQYADNKDLYNQKMMALYKKNGYSMFGSCLPTILTLVIFIVAINAFTNYSKFQNRQYFYNMSQSYNNVIYAGMELDGEYITRDEDGKLVIDVETLKEQYDSGEDKVPLNGYQHEILLAKEGEYFIVSTTNGYVKYKRFIDEKNEIGATESYVLVPENLDKDALKSEENNNLTILVVDENGNEKWIGIDEALKNEEMTAEKFITDIRQQKSAERYRAENQKFLWVKNIWVTDSAMSHPVESNWETFKSTHGYPSDGEDIKEEGYNQLIAKLEFEKNAPNGFFILVVLTAGMSFLMQIVMGNSQKAQMELQTVDGQGAQTQKIMKWMMPMMMAFFSFMYTAAFSLYIIISNVLSIATTYGINFIVDRKFKKAEGLNKEKKVVRGRVYTPKEEPKEKPKKEKKVKKEEPKADFLSGTADVKKDVRGRTK